MGQRTATSLKADTLSITVQSFFGSELDLHVSRSFTTTPRGYNNFPQTRSPLVFKLPPRVLKRALWGLF